jgi:hypothetical protein
VCVCVCVCVYICVCVCVYIYVCVCVCVYVSEYVSVYMCMCVNVCSYLDAVTDGGASRQHTGVDSREGEGAHEGVVHDLEGQGREGLLIRGFANDLGF